MQVDHIQEPITVAPNPPSALLFQMITQNHELAEAGHKRLRADIREMEKEIDRVHAHWGALNEKLTKIEHTPLNVDKVSFSSRQLAVIVGAALSIALGMWQLHVGVDALQSTMQNATKLQDERNETQKQAMDQLRAAIEMRRVEIQNLSNFIQQNVPQKQVPPARR